MSLTIRRRFSVKVWGGLLAVCLLLCAGSFLRAASSRALGTQPDGGRSASSQQPAAAPATQPASPISHQERRQQDEARAFYQAKRAPEDKAGAAAAESLQQSYIAARRRVCQMAATGQDRELLTGVGGAWMRVGPQSGAPHALATMVDPCAADGATKWTPPQFDFGATLFAHGQVYPGGAEYLGGTLDRGLVRGEENGRRTMLKGALGQVAIDPSDANVLYVAGPGLQLRKSRDSGRSFAAATEGLVDEGLLVAPLALDANDSQRLWLGGRSIWRSVDGAEQWTKMSAPAADGAHVSALAVAAANSGHVLAGTSAGDIHRTFNSFNLSADEAWPSVRPRAGFVSSLAYDPYHPNLAYATYSTVGGAHVWRSYDAGASWTSIDGAGALALPDVPVHSLVVDPTNPARLYVGTDLGVFVSLDGGASWAMEEAGFGQAIVESLSIGQTGEGPALFAFTHGQGVWRLALSGQQCSYTISPSRSVFEATGGTGGVNVMTASACAWTATSNANWVMIDAGATGTGNGTVSFTVAANTAATVRTATLTIAGQSFIVEQGAQGGSCITTPIASGQIVSGVLAPGDCFSRQRSTTLADRYSFTGIAGELVAVALNASFNSLIYLYGPNDALVTQSNSSNNTRLPDSGFFMLPTTGTYLIEVTALFSDARGNYTFNLQVVPAGCGFYTLLPTNQSFDATGGEGSVQVATGSNCPWTATSNVDWVTITSGASGGGSLSVTYRVAANTGTYRTGTLTIAGQTFTIQQAGAGGSCVTIPITEWQTINGTISQADCRSRNRGSTSYYADRYSFTGQAGQQIIITAGASFAPQLYLTTTNDSDLAAGETRIPAGRGSFAVPADGTYIIEVTTRDSNATGSYALTLTVLPPGCGYAITPSDGAFEATGGTGSITVTTGADCAWTATTGASWITIADGTGTGQGTVAYTVAANEGAYRTAVIVVAGQSVTIVQAGAGGSCLTTQPLMPGQTVSGQLNNADCRSRLRMESFGNSVFYAERYSFDGTAGQQVRLTTTSTNLTTYLYLTDAAGTILADGRQRIPTSGGFFVLPATATYFVEVTSEFSSGAGIYTLSLETLSSTCGYTIAPSLLRFDSAGGTGQITVTTSPGCQWMAASNASWLTITGEASGAGNGTVNIAVAANNTTVLRRATLTIAGQTIAIEQAGTGGTCLPQALAVNQPVMGSVSSADCQFTDRYGFTANAGDQVAAIVVSTTLFNPMLRILDGQGRVLASGTTRAPIAGFIRVPETGTYFVELIAPSANPNTYTLTLVSVAANCSYALAPASQRFDAAGGTGSVMVTTADNCQRLALSSVSWLTITAGANDSGAGTVEFTVAPNTGSTPRTGTINIGGRAFTVEQAGAGGNCVARPISLGETINSNLNNADCRSSIRTSSTFYADRYSFDFTAGQQFAIAYEAASLIGYIYLTDANGAVLAEGTGQQFRIPTGNNFLTLPSSGTYFIEVTSQGSFATGNYMLRLLAPTECAYSFLPMQQRIESEGGASSFNIVTAENCQWAALSDVPWLTVNTTSGTGSGPVGFTVAANNNSASRTGTINVGSQSFTIEQAGAGGTCGPQPLAANQPLSASLSSADCRVRLSSTSTETRPVDRYSFTGAEADQIALVITSSLSIQTLTLIDPRGLIVAQGNARIPATGGYFTLPASGTYTVEFSVLSGFNTGNYTITLLTIPAGCTYTVTPERQAFEFAGGAGSVTITTSENCAWTILDIPSWITFATNSGTGSGAANFTVALNASLSARSATLMVGGRSLVIEQAGVGGSCATLPLTPGQFVNGALSNADCPGRLMGATRADRYSFEGTAGEQISLQALLNNTSGPSLLLGIFAPDGTQLARVEGTRLPASGLLTLPASGTYLVEIATQFTPGSDSGYRLLLTTAPGGCVYALNPSRQSFDAAGGAGSVNVLTGEGCAWTITSTVNWITLATNSGTGNGAVNFTIAPNASFTLRRGELFIGGQVFTFEQAGAGGNCSPVPITPDGVVMGQLSDGDCTARVRAGVPGDRYSFTAEAGQQILITVATEQNSGLRPEVYLLDANGAVLAIGTSVTSTTSVARLPAGSGFFALPGAGTYFVEVVPSSNTGSNRGNYTLALTLTTAGCAYAINPAQGVFDANQATGSFNVITGASCTWTAASNASWITISSGASGTGNGAVNFAVAANTGAVPRTGTINVADQVYTITQAGMGGTCVAAMITPGQTVNSNLSPGDCNSLVRSQTRADRYVFNGNAGDRVAIALTTQLPSPMLVLLGPDGVVLAQADAMRLPRAGTIILPATGQYVIEFSSFSTGAYMLNLSLQTACAYTVTPTTLIVESAGGMSTVMVTAAAGCDWSATAMSDWISLPASSNFGSGNGTFGFTVAPNPNAAPRTGTLVIAGQIITVMQVGRVTLVSAASFGGEELAPDSIAVAFGQGLATSTAIADTPTLPLTLAGTTVKVRDSAGTTRDAALFAVTPTQVNFLAPAGAALGDATVIITSGSGTVTTGTTRIAAVAPSLFTANADGRGVAAGVVLRIRNGVPTFEPLARFDQMTSRFVPTPIDLGPAGDEVFLILFGTGVRNRTALAAVTAEVGGVAAPVLFAGAQGLAGLDQLNLALPRSLAGRGEVNVTVIVDGKPVNVVQVVIR